MRVPCVLALLLAALFLPLPGRAVFADDEKPESAVEVPPYAVEDLAPRDDERPDGWEPVTTAGGVPASGPSVKALLDLAKAAGVDLRAVSARSRTLRKADGTAAVLTLVGVDASPDAFTGALAEAALKNGWQVRELGSSMRVAVVASTSKEAGVRLLTWVSHLAVGRLCELVWDRVVAARDQEAFQRAIAVLQTAGRIEPEASAFHALRGRVFEALRNGQGALAAYRKALADGAPVPAKPAWMVIAAGRVGHLLLTEGSEEVLEEALAALKKAVALEKHGDDDTMKFGNRYNLACTYARLGRVDEALTELEGSLKLGKEILGEDYASHYEHAKERDPDMEPLRKDARFAALLEKYAP